MKKIAKILVPTDLSEVSLSAMEYAHLMPSQSRAHIYLLHIIENHSASCGDKGMKSDTSPLSCACALQKELEDSFFIQLYRYENIACVIRRGDPSAEIRKFAEEEKIDLIVMTTHGEGYFNNKILGTVAEQILQCSALQVIFVRPMQIHSLIQPRKEYQS